MCGGGGAANHLFEVALNVLNSLSFVHDIPGASQPSSEKMDLTAFQQDIQKWLPWLSSEAITEWDDFFKHQLPQLCSIDGDYASR